MSEVIYRTWIERAVSERQPETATLDFKRTLPGTEDRARRDFLCDCAAFANAAGGQLVFGIAEQDGRAGAIAPLQGSQDGEVQRLQNMLKDGVEPRIDGVEVRAVPLVSGFAVVVDIPPQFNGPFQARLGTWSRFTIRNGTSNADMSYRQLRDAFGRRERLTANMRAWRKERVTLVSERARAGRLAPNVAWLVLHVMPVASFAEELRVDLHRIKREGFRLRQHAATGRFNLDGVYFRLGSSAPPTEYVQIFRNGAFEHAWRSQVAREDRYGHPTVDALNHLYASLLETFRTLHTSDVEGAVVVALSLVSAEGSRLWTRQEGYPTLTPVPFAESDALLDEHVVERPQDARADLEPLLKDILDGLYQAYEEDECDYFDAGGKVIESVRRELRLPR